MLDKIKRTINLIRLIPTVISCAVLAFYAGYLVYAIQSSTGNTNANIVFLVITAISFVMQILLYSRRIKRDTSRRVKRLCKIVKLHTHIITLIIAIYSASADGSLISILMLPVWFIQLVAEIAMGILGAIKSAIINSAKSRIKSK